MRFILACLIFLTLVGCSSHLNQNVQKEYYKTGILKSVKSYDKGILNGISREYHEAGTLKHAIHYRHDQIDGMYHTYYPNGSLWAKEVYRNGVRMNRDEYNDEGEIIKKENF